MKKNTLPQFSLFPAILLVIAVFISPYNYAQNWSPLGVPGFSIGPTVYTSVAVAPDGTPYVVYQDDTNNKRATVMKYNSTSSSWELVGNAGFSAGPVYGTSIAIDRSGTPYVVYGDGILGQYATVKKFNGTSWVTVGSPGFSANEADYTTIAIDSGGTPYVAYEDWGNDQKATVMKFDGTAWVNVGTAGFSDTTVNYTSIALDPTGTPYVAYVDLSFNYSVTVMKYNGTAWVAVGTPDFADSNSYYTSLAIDGNGTPYVAFEDGSSYGATVMKYDGSTWVVVGYPGFTFGGAYYIALTIDRFGTPYVAYTGDYPNYLANVMSYDGAGNWSSVGSPDFSDGVALYNSIAVDNNGSIYMAYQDGAHNNAATVMAYQNPNAVKNISSSAGTLSLFPDPIRSGEPFTLNISSTQKENVTVTVTNVLGEKVKELNTATNTDTQIQLDSPPGMYFISAVTTQGELSGKAVIW